MLAPDWVLYSMGQVFSDVLFYYKYEVKRGTLKIDFLAQKHKTITQQGLQLGPLNSKFSMLTVSWAPCVVPMINERCLFFFTQAYHFSPVKKIVGVEINSELCDLQQKITEKYRMHDRVEVSLLNLKKKNV